VSTTFESGLNRSAGLKSTEAPEPLVELTVMISVTARVWGAQGAFQYAGPYEDDPTAHIAPAGTSSRLLPKVRTLSTVGSKLTLYVPSLDMSGAIVDDAPASGEPDCDGSDAALAVTDGDRLRGADVGATESTLHALEATTMPPPTRAARIRIRLEIFMWGFLSGETPVGDQRDRSGPEPSGCPIAPPVGEKCAPGCAVGSLPRQR
jgi:hypothetical protein